MSSGPNDVPRISALIEWRDARIEFFAAAKDEKGMVPKPIWDRLANAEHALMDAASALSISG